MRRFFTASLLALAITASIVPSASAHASGPDAPWRWKRCRFQTVQAGDWTVTEVQLTIECAVRHFPTSLSTADYVANRESNFRYWATNSSSGACGIYQHLPRYWYTRWQSFNSSHPWWGLVNSCYNARSNVLVAIRMASMGGWGPWGM